MFPMMQAMRFLAAAILLAGAVRCLGQADPAFVRMWEAAQRQRPAEISSVARIAPVGEPGTALRVSGRLLQKDGAPAANLIIFAYQTDANGVYHRPGEKGWRLQGWVRTDDRGRFQLETVRPAPYPAGRTPAHVHLHVEGPGVPRQFLPELRFIDDPFLSEAEKKAEGVCNVMARRGIHHVDVTLRLSDRGRF